MVHKVIHKFLNLKVKISFYQKLTIRFKECETIKDVSFNRRYLQLKCEKYLFINDKYSCSNT